MPTKRRIPQLTALALVLLGGSSALACYDDPAGPTNRESGAYYPPPVVPPVPPVVPPPAPPAEQYDPHVSSPFIVDTGATPGGRLVFTLGAGFWDGVASIYSMRPDGTELMRLTSDDVGDVWAPSWSPDGSLIVYATYGSPHGNDVWVMRADGSGRRPVTEGDYPFWLANGRIAYACSYTDICAVDESGTNSAVLIPGATSVTGFGFSLSPDGSMFAYMRQVENEAHAYYGLVPYLVRIARRDGSDARRLTTTDSTVAFEYGPTWSPDGRQIAFGSKAFGIAVIDADGGRLHSISRHDDIRPLIGRGALVWSPDGKQVLFGGESGTFFIANADGSGLIRRVSVPAMPARMSVGTWSWSKR